MTALARCIAIIVLAGLAACGTGVTSRNVENRDARDLFASAASRGDILVTVLGNPFSVDDNVLAAAVTGAMENGNSSPPTGFTTRPPVRAEPGFRIVVAFNPRPGLAEYRLCHQGTPPFSMRPTDRDLSVVMAFCGGPWLRSAFCGATGWCRQSGLISAVEARAPMAQPGDPAFHRLLAGMISELIPGADVRLQGRY